MGDSFSVLVVRRPAIHTPWHGPCTLMGIYICYNAHAYDPCMQHYAWPHKPIKTAEAIQFTAKYNRTSNHHYYVTISYKTIINVMH